MTIVNDTIRDVIETLKQQLENSEILASSYHNDFKRHELKIVKIKESIAELEIFLESQNAKESEL